ncbi:DUF3761 domain-containing protein [uncultured Williamsia sp.]|uniref:DUF3761 domain-containing protein n=1 Tax=uncultured Williamsia sp. TaxID=259311 RepID=UPI002626F965|nr:DUF3761 domain-containing protein [uncultured Williamsia sp.]
MTSRVVGRFSTALAVLVLAVGVLVAAPTFGGVPAASADTGVAHSVSDGCGSGYYENSRGRCIPTPDGSTSSIRCKDGTYSHAENRSGACSRHGGISGGSGGDSGAADAGVALGVLGVGSAVVGVATLLPLLLGGLLFGS